MRPEEQQSLLFRQLAALRRRGLAHHEALEATRPGLPGGPLRDRVDGALQSLASGGDPDPDPLLGREAPAEALARAADAVDAHLAARAGTATVRLYLGLALGVPLVVWSLGGWLSPGDALGELGPGTWGLLTSLLAAMRLAGLPAALAVVLVVRRLDLELGSGVGRIRRAATLYEAASTGAQPHLEEASESLYLHTRTQTCGVEQATAELADELARSGRARLEVFRHVGPVVGLLIALLVGIPPVVLLVAPIFGYLRSLVL